MQKMGPRWGGRAGGTGTFWGKHSWVMYDIAK